MNKRFYFKNADTIQTTKFNLTERVRNKTEIKINIVRINLVEMFKI